MLDKPEVDEMIRTETMGASSDSEDHFQKIIERQEEELEKRLLQLSDENHKLKEKNESLEDRVNQIRNENHNLKKEIEFKKKETECLNLKVKLGKDFEDRLEKELRQTKEENLNVKRELERAFRKLLVKNVNLVEENKLQNKKTLEIDDEMEKLKVELNKIKEENQSHIRLIEKQRVRYEVHRGEIRSKDKEISALSNKVQSSEKKLRTMKSELEDAKAQQESRIEESKGHLEDLRTKIEVEMKKRRAVQSKLETLSRTVTNIIRQRHSRLYSVLNIYR